MKKEQAWHEKKEVMNHHVMPDFYKLGNRLLFYRLRTSTFDGTDFASAVIDKRAIALDVIYYRIFTKFDGFCTNRFTVERSCFQLCTFNIFDVMNRSLFRRKETEGENVAILWHNANANVFSKYIV